MKKILKTDNKQKTKIVATLGPSSSDSKTLLELIRAGVDVFRLNFSHGTHEDHLKIIEKVTQIRDTYNVSIGLLADLQGPKIRLGNIENGSIEISEGEILDFTTESAKGTKSHIFVNYSNFPKDVSAGEKVLIDDGKVVLEVQDTDRKSHVKLKVIHGHTLSSNKGVNLPDTKLSLPSLTKKDLHDLEFVLTQPFNWIALSFVRKSKDITELSQIIKSRGHGAKIIAKVEKPEALSNIKSIIRASDAVMVARGDLGIEVPMEKLPGIQKSIIRRCIQSGKPVIVATQMMESMITNPSPTRAETTDVANAVIDGADAVMLSAETSVGNFPIEVVSVMNRIITEAEKDYEIMGKRPKADPKSNTYLSDVICYKAAKTAEEVHAKGIIGLTVSGYTAFKVSSFRANIPIYIFSHKKEMLDTLNLVWGVKCFHYDKFTSTDETIQDLVKILKNEKLLKKGDLVINTGSMPLKSRSRTNMMKITIID